jgi:hypothetical protein
VTRSDHHDLDPFLLRSALLAHVIDDFVLADFGGYTPPW